MSRGSSRKHPMPTVEPRADPLQFAQSPAAPVVAETPARAEQPATEVSEPDMPKHRQCPLCWGVRKGYGLAYSTHNPSTMTGDGDWKPNVRRRFYKCAKAFTDLGPCGYTWVVTVETQVTRIESRPVDLQTRAD